MKSKNDLGRGKLIEKLYYLIGRSNRDRIRDIRRHKFYLGLLPGEPMVTDRLKREILE